MKARVEDLVLAGLHLLAAFFLGSILVLDGYEIDIVGWSFLSFCIVANLVLVGVNLMAWFRDKW